MTYAIDLDGCLFTTCEWWKPGAPDPEPIPDRIAVVRSLHSAGHVIVIHTSRSGNLDRARTEALLARNLVPYDRIHFDKPLADAYVDDKALAATDIHTLLRRTP